MFINGVKFSALMQNRQTNRRSFASAFLASDEKPTPTTTQSGKTNRPSWRAEDNMADKIAQMRERQEMLRIKFAEMAKQTQAAREAARKEMEYFRLMRLAMEIAARIQRGDNVPQSDKEFLLKQSPGAYMLAMAARNQNNEDPKDHEALAKWSDRKTDTSNANSCFSAQLLREKSY